MLSMTIRKHTTPSAKKTLALGVVCFLIVILNIVRLIQGKATSAGASIGICAINTIGSSICVLYFLDVKKKQSQDAPAGGEEPSAAGGLEPLRLASVNL